MNLELRKRIEHLVRVLQRRRIFLNAHGRQVLANAQRMLDENPDDATIALAVRELTDQLKGSQS